MTATATYDIGDEVTATVGFEAGGLDTDPTTVQFFLQNPAGVETSYTYNVDATVQRDDVGDYHADIEPNLPGLWRWRFVGSGNMDAVLLGAFYVRSAFAPIPDIFGTVDLMSEYLQEDIDPADPLALFVLAAAATAARKYCDAHISIVTDDVAIVDGSGSDVLLLPEHPVIDVTTVIEDYDLDSARTLTPPGNGNESEYDWSDSGLLIHRTGTMLLIQNQFSAKYGTWPNRRRSVQVTYSHGFATIPYDIQLVCVASAARGWAQDGANSETAGSYTAQYAGQPASFTKDEQRILDRYRARRK